MLSVLIILIWLSLFGGDLCRASKEAAGPRLDTRRHDEMTHASAALAGDDFLDLDFRLRKLLQDAAPFVWGGEDAPENRFPYACSLRTVGPRIHGCGGVLIDKKWVLTAAHCVSGPKSIGATPAVYVGAYGIDDEASAEVRTSSRVFIHENWSGDTNGGYDIALLLLDEESTKQPVRLPDPTHVLGPNQIVVAAGWGRTSHLGALSEVLQMTKNLEYVSTANCQRVWPLVTENMLCAHSTTASTCGGDSGGPLVIPDTHHDQTLTDGDPGFDMLVGLVSFGPDDCGQTEDGRFKPGVYTRVSSFRLWIDEKMGSLGGTSTSTTTAPTTADKDDAISTPPPADKDSTPTPTPDKAETPSPVEDDKPKGKCDPALEDCEKLNNELADVAFSNGGPAKIEELISRGADVNFDSPSFGTPLRAVAVSAFKFQEGSEGMVDLVASAKMLIEAGADVNAQSGGGVTPLIEASRSGSPSLVQLLLDNGAEIDHQDESGQTAVFEAAFNGYGGVIAVLKLAGADLDHSNNNGDKPVDVVCGCADPTFPFDCKPGQCDEGEKELLQAIFQP